MKHNLGYAKMLPIFWIIVDSTLVQFAEFQAHFLQETTVDVVVQIGEGDLFGGHRAHPVLVTFEARHRQVKRVDQVVPLWFDDREKQAGIFLCGVEGGR